MTPNIRGLEDSINRIQPSHGVGILAGRLREMGHEVLIRDTALEGYDRIVPNLDGRTVTIGESEEDTARYIEDFDPDVVAVSVLFSNLIEHGKSIVGLTKKINPGIKTILGGNHVNYMYNDVIAHPSVDFVLRGECDFTLESLISAIVNGEDVSGTPGIVYKKDGGAIVVGNDSGRVVDLDELPREARDLMNMEGYFNINLFHSPVPRRVASIMATRGCPEKCTFCTTPQMWGSKVRWRSPKNIYEEITSLIGDYGIEEVQFEDDSLTANRKKLLELCDLIEPLGLMWCTPNGVKVNYHAKNSNNQRYLFRRMRESGCYQITFAVETGNQRILDDVIDKRLSLDSVKPTVEAAKEAGMFVHTFFMVGFPGETYEEMERTVRFAESIEADSYSLNILCPLPGTTLYEKAKSEGLFIDGFSEDQIMFRKSLLNVQGFSSNTEFEEWVDSQNLHLNGLLKKRDYERFRRKYGAVTDERLLRKRT